MNQRVAVSSLEFAGLVGFLLINEKALQTLHNFARIMATR